MPNQERRKEIEKQANKILLENKLLPGFDLISFLVQKQEFQIVSQVMDEDTTGILLVDDNNCIPNTKTHRLITINANLASKPNFIQKRRFITAHEFAHLILHKQDQTQYAHRDHSQSEAPEEKEADFFARCLLMPQNTVKQILELDFVKVEPFDEKINIIANFFNVTYNKAKKRLVEDLGYNG